VCVCVLLGYVAGQPPYQPEMSQPQSQPGGFVGGHDAAQTGYAQMHARQQDAQVCTAFVMSVCGPCLLWPNSWIDEDATWYQSRPQSRPHCVRWGHSK